jgi:hypothetical protein
MNRNPLFESDRMFVVFSYSMSHGLLLLRSRKAGRFLTRIDILFQDVRAMELRSWFTGVSIEQVEADYLLHQRSKPAELIEPGNVVYLIAGSGWDGFVVGGRISFLEDDGDAFAPSGLMVGS